MTENTEKISIPLIDLIAYAIRYDDLNCSFPESQWEGRGFLLELIDYLKIDEKITKEDADRITRMIMLLTSAISPYKDVD
jgi:hypothetical protein